jgi:hypothetical protein
VNISFRSPAFRAICVCRKKADEAWGPNVAAIIRRRLDDLCASGHLQLFLALPHIRHDLVGRSIRVHIDERWALLLDHPAGQPDDEASGTPRRTSTTVLGLEERNETRRK